MNEAKKRRQWLDELKPGDRVTITVKDRGSIIEIDHGGVVVRRLGAILFVAHSDLVRYPLPHMINRKTGRWVKSNRITRYISPEDQPPPSLPVTNKGKRNKFK